MTNYTPNINLKKPLETDIVDINDFNSNYDKIDQAIGEVKTGSNKIEGLETLDKTIAGAINEIKKSQDSSNIQIADKVSLTTLDEYKLQVNSELNKKLDKVEGKGLSTNDYTNTEKNKLSGIATGANNYVHPISHPATMITTADASSVQTKLDGLSTQVAEKADKDGTVQTGLNSEKINGKTASATPSTTEKTDIIGMVNELFTNANDGKTKIANVIGSPATVSDTFTILSNKIQTHKNTLANNLSSKGVSASGSESLSSLSNKVSNIALAVSQPLIYSKGVENLPIEMGKMVVGGKGTVAKKESNHLLLYLNWSSSLATFVTSIPVDLTNVSYISVDSSSNLGESVWYKFSVVVSTNKMGDPDTYNARSQVTFAEFPLMSHLVDVRNLTGYYYIRCQLGGYEGASGSDFKSIYINNILLIS